MRLLHSVLLGVGLAIFGASTVGAQSEADKATARTLAHEGVRLQDQKQYALALDRLQRAQALYNAPSHLLHIAQCQVALGQLVEGAETYRLLARTDPGTIDAFQKAKAQGAQELSALEPKIPTVRIEIRPAQVAGAQVRIDRQPVSSAVLGVDRVINPGAHLFEVSAPGYRTAQVQQQVGEGQHPTVQLQLEKDQGPAVVAPPSTGTLITPPPPSTAPAASTAPSAPPPVSYPSPPPATEKKPFHWGLVGSLRLQGTFAGGEFPEARYPQVDVELRSGKLSSSLGSGGGAELQAGVRLANHLGLVLLVGGDSFGTSDKTVSIRGGSGSDDERTAKVTAASSSYGGLGLQYYSCRDCRLGLFLELGLITREFTQKVEYVGNQCQVDLTRKAGAGRLLVGAPMPVSRHFLLMPYVALSGGNITSTTTKVSQGSAGGCSLLGRRESLEVTADSDSDDKTYSLFNVGLSGSYILDFDRK